MRFISVFLMLIFLLGVVHEVRPDPADDIDPILQRDRARFDLQHSTNVEALTPEQRVIALDPLSAIETIRRLVEEHAEVATLLLILMPEDGVLMPQVLEGQLTGWAAFDPEKVDLEPLLDELAGSIDPVRGMAPGSTRRFYESLSRSAESAGSMLPDDEMIVLKAHVEMDVYADNRKRLVIVSTRLFGAQENYPDQMITLEQSRIVLTLSRPEDGAELPLRHPDLVDRKATLHTIVDIAD